MSRTFEVTVTRVPDGVEATIQTAENVSYTATAETGAEAIAVAAANAGGDVDPE
jgi:hypothetical protein